MAVFLFSVISVHNRMLFLKISAVTVRSLYKCSPLPMKLRQIRDCGRESLLTRNLRVAYLVSFNLGPGYILLYYTPLQFLNSRHNYLHVLHMQNSVEVSKTLTQGKRQVIRKWLLDPMMQRTSRVTDRVRQTTILLFSIPKFRQSGKFFSNNSASHTRNIPHK